jgi:prepilin-type N-terminal cleavage/methylation domain-containing protein
MIILFKKKGFSLTEILMTVALLGLVLIVICSVFFRALMGIRRGQSGATAMYIANRKIDEVKSIDLGKVSGIDINELYQHIEGYDPPPVDLNSYISWDPNTVGVLEKTITGKEGTLGEYEFTISIKQFYENSSPVTNLKSIIVEVKWYDNLQQKKKSLKIDTLLARRAY